MSESGQMSVGQTLRAAREAQGVALDDAAVRLRLMHRQIEAMETDDFESLGQPVFARGFVRNYARLLGLDTEALLTRMKGAPEAATLVPRVEPPPAHFWLTSPLWILLLLGALLLVAMPVGLYLWLNSDVDEASNDAPVVQAPLAEVPEAASPPTPASEPAAQAAPPEPQAPVAVEAATDRGVLHLQFGDESWVEIKDASGRMLQRQLNLAGSSADIQGQPPFDVVIGNAAQVQMTYNGRPIDLKPFIEVTVARFTLEE